MKLTELVSRVESLDPSADASEVARTCLLLTNFVDDLDQLDDEANLSSAWREMGLRLQFASDQHAATTSELEHLAASDPKEFHLDQVWVLLRAIKVQGQVLHLYLGGEAIDV